MCVWLCFGTAMILHTADTKCCLFLVVVDVVAVVVVDVAVIVVVMLWD
jgi:hypothetical protein